MYFKIVFSFQTLRSLPAFCEGFLNFANKACATNMINQNDITATTNIITSSLLDKHVLK